ATIKLNPPELGPLEINIKVNHNRQADVMISTQHGIVKDSIEHALPRLREMLADSGIQLNNVNVQDQSLKQQGHMQQQASKEGSGQGGTFFDVFFGNSQDENSQQATYIRRSRPDGLVDYYA